MLLKKITTKSELCVFIMSQQSYYMKINASVTKNSHQDCRPCYLHLPTFFLYIFSSSAGK